MVDKLSREALLERSLAASQTSNEHSRAVGQACILINGGAATAVIAFLAKDKLEASIFSQAAICLAGYAVGVFFATAMMFCATQSFHYS